MRNKTILITRATGYLGNKLSKKLDYNIIAVCLNHNETFSFDKKFSDRVKKIYLSDISIKEIFKQNRWYNSHRNTLWASR